MICLGGNVAAGQNNGGQLVWESQLTLACRIPRVRGSFAVFLKEANSSVFRRTFTSLEMYVLAGSRHELWKETLDPDSWSPIPAEPYMPVFQG